MTGLSERTNVSREDVRSDRNQEATSRETRLEEKSKAYPKYAVGGRPSDTMVNKG
jgi:hypothetical protein